MKLKVALGLSSMDGRDDGPATSKHRTVHGVIKEEHLNRRSKLARKPQHSYVAYKPDPLVVRRQCINMK